MEEGRERAVLHWVSGSVCCGAGESLGEVVRRQAQLRCDNNVPARAWAWGGLWHQSRTGSGRWCCLVVLG